jgi:hypothetical protein
MTGDGPPATAKGMLVVIPVKDGIQKAPKAINPTFLTFCLNCQK